MSAFQSAIENQTAAAVATLVRDHSADIAAQLAESSKLSVSISVRLVVIGEKVTGKCKIAWAKKFQDEEEFTANSDQPELPGTEVEK